MKSLSTDTELLVRSVDEPSLFAGLYERYGLAVRRYVIRRIGDTAGDDLASEVFVRAFRAPRRYRAQRNVAAGDSGDERVRHALERGINGRRRRSRRVRLPFGTRSITLMPAALLTIAVTTAAAAGTVALFQANPTILFKKSPLEVSGPGVPHETVIPSTST